MGEFLIEKARSVLLETSCGDAAALAELVIQTRLRPHIGGYILSPESALRYGLGVMGSITRHYTDLPFVYDHQSAGLEFDSEAVSRFIDDCKSSRVNGVVIYPFGGPASTEAWIKSLQDEDIKVVLACRLDNPDFLESEGGFVVDGAPEKALELGTKLGVRNFYLSGKDISWVQYVNKLLKGQIEREEFDLFLKDRGGDLDVAQVDRAVNGFGRWHRILRPEVFFRILKSPDAARQLLALNAD